MTQTPTKKPETPWQVTFPKDDTQTDHSRRSLVAACYGHEGVARVLDRFVYLASWKVKNERLESCKDVQLSLTHKDILESLQKSNNYNITRKTLIKYLDRLHEWKYVTCPRYGRTYIVHFEPVQAAIDQPPERTPKARRPKCCKVVRKSEEDNATTLQLSSEITLQHYTNLLKEHEELAQKVVSLQQNVEQLQLKVVSLQQNVGNVTTLQHDLASLERLVHGYFTETPVINHHLPSFTGKGTYGDDAIAYHPLITLTSLLDEEDEFERLIDGSTLKGITSPSDHHNEQQASDNSYSQQDALVENGEDHEHRESLRPAGRYRDHSLNADVHHVPADLRSAQGAAQAQQPALENNNDSHSHSQETQYGLMDEPAAGSMGAGRSAGTQSTPPGGSSQSGDPGARRLPVADGAASGDAVRSVRGKAREQASPAATARARARGSANGCDASVQEVAHASDHHTLMADGADTALHSAPAASDQGRGQMGARTSRRGVVRATSGTDQRETEMAFGARGEAESTRYGRQQASSEAVAPHQGRAQTPSLSVENPVVVGGKSKVEDEVNKPTRTSKKAKSEGKKVTSLEPVPPPDRPDADAPFDVKKILAWGDYARQYAFPLSERSNSKSWKAREAARCIAGLNLQEDFFLTMYFNWMKGIRVDLGPLPDNALKSATWPDYSVDLWVFAEHAPEEIKKYREAKAKRERTERTSSQHDETPIVKVLSPEELERKQASLQRAREAKEAIRQEMAAMAAYNAQFQSIGGAR